MSPTIANLLEQMRGLEDQLEGEIAKQHAKLGVGLEKGRVLFE